MNRHVTVVQLTALALPLLSSPLLTAQNPTIHEAGWTLRATVVLATPVSPHVSPLDGSVFVTSQTGGWGSIHRIDRKFRAPGFDHAITLVRRVTAPG